MKRRMKRIITKPDSTDYFTAESKNGMIFLHNINMFSVCFDIKALDQLVPFLQQAMENDKRGE